MWEIWANQLLPKAFKICPKSNKSPDLVTLVSGEIDRVSIDLYVPGSSPRMPTKNLINP